MHKDDMRETGLMQTPAPLPKSALPVAGNKGYVEPQQQRGRLLNGNNDSPEGRKQPGPRRTPRAQSTQHVMTATQTMLNKHGSRERVHVADAPVSETSLPSRALTPDPTKLKTDEPNASRPRPEATLQETDWKNLSVPLTKPPSWNKDADLEITMPLEEPPSPAKKDTHEHDADHVARQLDEISMWINTYGK